MYHKTDVLGLQELLREKFYFWAGNGSCMEDIWKSYKDIIFEGIKRYVAHKILGKNPDPEYYNKEVKSLKVKVRKMYDRRKLGQPYQRELKRLSKGLLVAKKKAQETFLSSVYKTKADAGQSSTSMSNVVKEIEKIFRRSRTIMERSLQIH